MISKNQTYLSPLMKDSYDYIICGGGLAGLSLAYRMCTGSLQDKKVLIIDKDSKRQNDRTWCFWEKEINLFESIVYKSWDKLDFFSNHGHIPLETGEYSYKMIRGIDFYNHCLQIIEKSSNADFMVADIQSINSVDNGAVVKTSKGRFQSPIIFNSAIREKIDKTLCNYVDQHFKGWIINTKTKEFNSEKATFMDFRIDQNGEARFFYVLPTSDTRALVEVAIFSNEILSEEDYDLLISDYINDYLQIESYKIEEKEFGVIPMTDYPFKRVLSPNVINLGTTGGAVKPSSGYAFKRIQEQCDDIINKIENGIYPIPDRRKSKYTYLDGILLNVVQTNKCSSAEVFYRLFSKHKATLIFKFLDEQSSVLDDLKVVSAPPVLPFLKAALEKMTSFARPKMSS